MYNITTDAAYFVTDPKMLKREAERSDIDLIAACVEAEAGNQDLTGKRLVADVILNRVDSEDFPDTIEGVISQPRHFATYWNGAIDRAEPSEETRRNINLYFLQTFYMTSYGSADSADQFYAEAADRMDKFEDAVL